MLLSNLVNVCLARREDHLFPFSHLDEFSKTSEYQLGQAEHPYPVAEAILLGECQPFSEHAVF